MSTAAKAPKTATPKEDTTIATKTETMSLNEKIELMRKRKASRKTLLRSYRAWRSQTKRESTVSYYVAKFLRVWGKP